MLPESSFTPTDCRSPTPRHVAARRSRVRPCHAVKRTIGSVTPKRWRIIAVESLLCRLVVIGVTEGFRRRRSAPTPAPAKAITGGVYPPAPPSTWQLAVDPDLISDHAQVLGTASGSGSTWSARDQKIHPRRSAGAQPSQSLLIQCVIARERRDHACRIQWTCTTSRLVKDDIGEFVCALACLLSFCRTQGARAKPHGARHVGAGDLWRANRNRSLCAGCPPARFELMSILRSSRALIPQRAPEVPEGAPSSSNDGFVGQAS